MAIPSKNILGNPNVTEGSFQVAIEQLRESVIGSGKVYDSANTYMIKDICEYSGVTYYSKINNNIGNTPSIGANWGDYADLLLGVVHKTGDETIAGVKTFSDNVGIGVTPGTITAGYKTLQINGSAGLALISSGNDTHLSTNAYYNSGYKYQTSGVSASDYSQSSGVHYWKTAPSGTAGNPITWTTAMTLGSNGNLLVGTTTDNGVDKLQVNGSVFISGHINHLGQKKLINFSNNYGGGSILNSFFGDVPIMGELYVVEIGTDKYLRATFYKRGTSYTHTCTVLASNGLTLGSSNLGGTQVINGATNNDNIRMTAEIKTVY